MQAVRHATLFCIASELVEKSLHELVHFHHDFKYIDPAQHKQSWGLCTGPGNVQLFS